MEHNLEVLIDSTRWFIANDPTTIVVTPHKPDSQQARGPGGGFVPVPSTARAPRQVKLVAQSTDGKSSGEGGSTNRFSYVLVDMPDSPLEPGDAWTDDNGNHWKIQSRLPENGYERKFNVVSEGNKPSDG